MIVDAKTPRSLSWSGRMAVLGVATLLLPLAPSWAQNDETTHAASSQPGDVDEPRASGHIEPGHRLDQTIEDRITSELEKDSELIGIAREIELAREQLDSGRRHTQEVIDLLNRRLERLQAEIDDKKGRLKELVKKGKIAVLKPELNGSHATTDASTPTLKTLSERSGRTLDHRNGQ